MIAIVDDDVSMGHSLERLLRSHDLASHAYTSVTDFKNSGTLTDISCLILDVRMPEQNGLDFQEELRAGGHHFPIIFMTGYLDDRSRERMRTSNPYDVFEKPFDPDLLIRTIKEAIDSKKIVPSPL